MLPNEKAHYKIIIHNMVLLAHEWKNRMENSKETRKRATHVVTRFMMKWQHNTKVFLYFVLYPLHMILEKINWGSPPHTSTKIIYKWIIDQNVKEKNNEGFMYHREHIHDIKVDKSFLNNRKSLTIMKRFYQTGLKVGISVNQKIHKNENCSIGNKNLQHWDVVSMESVRQ